MRRTRCKTIPRPGRIDVGGDGVSGFELVDEGRELRDEAQIEIE